MQTSLENYIQSNFIQPILNLNDNPENLKIKTSTKTFARYLTSFKNDYDLMHYITNLLQSSNAIYLKDFDPNLKLKSLNFVITNYVSKFGEVNGFPTSL